MDVSEKNILNNSDEIEIMDLNQEEQNEQEKDVKFWYKEGDNLKIDQNLFLEFFEQKGFRKYYVGNEYILVRVEDNIVKKTEIVQIKDFIINYIKNLKDEIEEPFNLQILKSKIILNPNLFSKPRIEFLPPLENKFESDTQYESFIYYRNCFVKISKEEITTHSYNELKGYIWQEHIKDRNFYISDKESEFSTFVFRICKEEQKRFEALRSALGYLLFRYKDPTKVKAIIFLDEKLDSGANGRSGKSLLGTAIGKIRKCVRLDGRSYKFDRFSFQSITPDTEIIDFNDVSEKFPFEKLFSVITDSLMVEMKHKDQHIMKFEETPKILISTNYTIEGHDHSTLDRQFIVEFSEHYNMNNTPISEFGHRFFENWDAEQWNSFDNFMISCIQFYLENGFVDYERVNLITKKLLASTSEDFLEFMKDKETGNEYNKSHLHNEFKEQYEDYSNQPQKTFTEWIKCYAKMKGYKYIDRKSNKERFFTLLDENKDERTNENGL